MLQEPPVLVCSTPGGSSPWQYMQLRVPSSSSLSRLLGAEAAAWISHQGWRILSPTVGPYEGVGPCLWQPASDDWQTREYKGLVLTRRGSEGPSHRQHFPQHLPGLLLRWCGSWLFPGPSPAPSRPAPGADPRGSSSWTSAHLHFRVGFLATWPATHHFSHKDWTAQNVMFLSQCQVQAQNKY